MMKYFILFTILFAFLANGNAQSNKNKYEGSLSVYHGETRLGKDIGLGIGPIETQVYINWAMWSLMGEPVYNVNAAVELRTHSLIVMKDGLSYTIPEEVLYKIRPIKITIHGVVESETIPSAGGNLSYGVIWDAGAPGKLFTPAAWKSSAAFDELSKEEKKKYYSFNVAGSPDWDKLFLRYENYISKKEAIKFFKSGIKLTKARAEIEWDLTPIKNYIAQQERLALDKKRAGLEKQKQELDKKQQEKEQAKKQKEEEDFWNTPANTETRDDAAEREAYEQAEAQLQSQYDDIDEREKDIENEKDRYDRLLADKREELEKRPKPGDFKLEDVMEFSYKKVIVDYENIRYPCESYYEILEVGKSNNWETCFENKPGKRRSLGFENTPITKIEVVLSVHNKSKNIYGYFFKLDAEGFPDSEGVYDLDAHGFSFEEVTFISIYRFDDIVHALKYQKLGVFIEAKEYNNKYTAELVEAEVSKNKAFFYLKFEGRYKVRMTFTN